MAITRADAVASLNEADAVGRKTRMVSGYALASPHLILWGVVWLVGYSACGLTDPTHWGWIWLPLIIAGAGGAALLGQRSRMQGVQLGASSTKSMLAMVAIAGFFVSVYTVFRPTTIEPYLVFPALVTALIYVGIGIYAAPRFGWIGLGIFVISIGGYLLVPNLLPVCIALAGGGGLILGGLWLRTI